MDQLTMCNGCCSKWWTYRYRFYHLALQFTSTVWSISASLNSVFWFSSSQLHCLFQSQCCHQTCFYPQQAADLSEKYLINSLFTTEQWTQKQAGIHSEAFSCERDQSRAKRILRHSSGGQKHNFKWMLMFLCVAWAPWMCKICIFQM